MENNYLDTMVERVSKGDLEAFRELCEYKADDIYYLAYRMLNNHHDVEDIAQEVTIKMYKSIGRLKKAGSFNAWVYSLVTNTCRDFLRKKKSRPEEVGYDEGVELVKESNTEFIPDKYNEEAEFENYLAKLIGSLPSDKQRCFQLYYFDKMKYKEIAEALDIKESTVGTNIMRAKEMIKKEIEKNSDYEVFFDNDKEQGNE